MKEQITGMNDFLSHTYSLMENEEHGVIDMHNLNCVSCNECCSISTMLTREEYEFFTNYFSNDPEGKKILQRARNKVKKYYRKNCIYGKCPFTDDETKKCGIYDIRPTICREFHCDTNIHRNYQEKVKKGYIEGTGEYAFYHFFEDILPFSNSKFFSTLFGGVNHGKL